MREATTGGLYVGPSGTNFGGSTDEIRDRTVMEFGRVAEALRRYPAIPLNSIPNLWIPGVLLTLATTAAAPAAVVRGAFPVAEYVVGATNVGCVSARILVPGLYQATLVYAQDAAGGGTVRWLTETSFLGSEGQLTPEFSALAGTTARNLTVAGPPTGMVCWRPFADLVIPAPGALGIIVSRTPAAAPDTATADAYVIGIALDRLRGVP